ncbi:MAG UNVERIFIED_CONTAM: hypothetical protein LVT10_26755 [Anaerolineae bacterium]|jgi:hypothetical protein
MTRWRLRPVFNPQDMIATDSGFEAALKALLDIEMQGIERLRGRNGGLSSEAVMRTVNK